MLIVCPSCATSYNIDTTSLGAAGRSVRCVRCKKTWFVSNPQAIATIARSHHEDVAAYAASTSVVDFAEPPAATSEPPVLASAPPLAPEGAPEDPPTEAPVVDELVRDDRGPAPLPEASDFEAPREPQTIDHDPTSAPAETTDAGPAQTIPEDIESVAARRTRRQGAHRRSRWPVPGWPSTVLALIALNAGLIAFRAEIVRWLPQTASLYAAAGMPVNLRGLVFSDITTRKEMQDGVAMLVVEGFITSTGRRPADVPRLRFAVRNDSGHEIYSWTALPARTVLAPGTTLPFRSRLASPPPEAHAVLVRFFNRRDLIAGIQ